MTGIHDNVDTYEPKVSMTYENSIPKVDNSFDDITDDNGNINIIINSEVIGQTLAKKIYTSWTSGLRELYNNEARACRTSKKMGGNPSIVITIDPNESSKQVIIQGVDSLGITKAMFNKVLRVIGTSGNTDGEEIGQYGMGFISYALMTDALLMETWSRETNEHYAMLCDSGLKFKPIPLDKNNDINTMSEFGTKLTMTCNDDVDFSAMIFNISQLARFSQIPTKIILLDNVHGESDYYGRHGDDAQDYDKGIIECVSYKNGMEYLKDSSKTEWLKTTTNEDREKVLLYDEITIDTDDYRFDGIIIIKNTAYGGVNILTNSRDIKMLLVGTSIDSNIRLNGLHSGIINVKNERKYSPVASRDSLEDKSRESLEDQIKNDLCVYLSKYNIETIDEYNASLNKCIIAQDSMYELKDYLSRGSSDISRTLNTRYSTPDKAHSTLNEMLATGGTIIALKSLRSNLMDLLQDHFDETVQFFRIPTRLTDEEKGHRIALFKELNIILGEEYKKQQQLKETRGKNTTVKNDGSKVSYSGDRQIILYNSTRGNSRSNLWGSTSGWRAGSNKYSTTINDVNENYHDSMITIDKKNWESMSHIQNSYSCNWKVMHDMKGIDEKVMTFDKLMNNVGKKMYQTNKGKVKGSDLKDTYQVVIIRDLELLDNIKSKEDTILGVHNIDEFVALEWYSKLHEGKIDIVDDTNGGGFEDVTRCHISLRNQSHPYHKGNDIARIYWIEQLLPDIYADIFTNAMMYNTEKNDDIEKVARQLNEVLKQ